MWMQPDPSPENLLNRSFEELSFTALRMRLEPPCHRFLGPDCLSQQPERHFWGPCLSERGDPGLSASALGRSSGGRPAAGGPEHHLLSLPLGTLGQLSRADVWPVLQRSGSEWACHPWPSFWAPSRPPDDELTLPAPFSSASLCFHFWPQPVSSPWPKKWNQSLSIDFTQTWCALVYLLSWIQSAWCQNGRDEYSQADSLNFHNFFPEVVSKG